MKRFPYPRRNMSFVIYGSKKCDYCTKSTKLLDNHNIHYTYYDIDKLIKSKIIKDYPEYIEKISRITNNYMYIPAIFMNGKFIGGYDKLNEKIN